MTHDKIIIIGCAGCGKSTMARALAEKTALPLYHLDKLWWRDNWTHITREELEAVQEQIMAQPRWIMDGNFNATMPRRLACCDTVIYLDFPRWLCLYSAVVRVLKNLGKAPFSMA